jgi:hypothetical protein
MLLILPFKYYDPNQVLTHNTIFSFDATMLQKYNYPIR